jgi:hypothetical protein
VIFVGKTDSREGLVAMVELASQAERALTRRVGGEQALGMAVTVELADAGETGDVAVMARTVASSSSSHRCRC